MPLAPLPFGNYLLLERLAIGGMAEVYLAKARGAANGDQLVAVKRILPNIAEDADFVAMFVDEAKIAGRLNHRNIARIYDLGQIHNSFFIAMEYVAGVDLRALWDQSRNMGPLPIDMVCHTAVKICEGLDYAHRRRAHDGTPLNIIHRDISPQNVLISFDGDVKIIDFGIAKASGRSVKTQTGVLKGKFAYMAPEQARGAKIDHRVDVFAVGVILYELATGERLYKAESDFLLLEKVRRVDFTPPSEIRPELAGELERIILKALAVDVEERYAWASALQLDLERYIVSHDLAFSREFLAQYVKRSFADDYEQDLARQQEYASITFASDAEGLVDSRTQVESNPPLAAHAVDNDQVLTQDEILTSQPVHDVTQIQASPFETEHDAGLNNATLVSEDPDLLAQVRQSWSDPEPAVDDVIDVQDRSSNEFPHSAQNATYSPDTDQHDEEIFRDPDDLAAQQHSAKQDSYTMWSESAQNIPADRDATSATEIEDSGAYAQDPQWQEPGHDNETLSTYDDGADATYLDPNALRDGQGGPSYDHEEAYDESPHLDPEQFSIDPREVQTQHIDARRHEATNLAQAAAGLSSTRKHLATAFLIGIASMALLFVLYILFIADHSGFLVVVTQPRQALIQLGDQAPQATNPAQFKVPPGTYSLRIQRPGIDPIFKTVQIASGELLIVDQVLPSGTGTLDITSDPSGAQVLVDGDAKGQTPISIKKIKADVEHRLELRHKATQSLSQTVLLSSGQKLQLSLSLPFKYTRITLQPIPSDAALYWKGRWRQNLTIPKVHFGKSVRYELRRPGCAPYVDEVKPNGERELTLAPSLECNDIDGGGQLTVTSARRGRVILDEVEIGRLPLLNYKLPEGQYKLKIRGRHQTHKQEIQIRAGEIEQIRTNLR